MRLLHLITSLDTGGAETMLFKLLSRLDKKMFHSSVVSIKPVGPLGASISSLGIKVSDLGVGRHFLFPVGFAKLVRIFAQFRPDIVQTWLYHADIMGLLAAKLTRIGRVVWNIRTSEINISEYRSSAAWAVRICALLSHLPEAVITNSYRGRDVHLINGYRAQQFHVIPNGFDLNFFRPDSEKRKVIRTELGVPNKTDCVGMIARFHPNKGHLTFLKAAEIIIRRRGKTAFILCGDNVDYENEYLKVKIKGRGLEQFVYLMGIRHDVPSIMASMDVVVSASEFREGFSNVVGEAMACAVPCVVTDVGDSARIVGDTGTVVPPRDPIALANAIEDILQLPDEERRRLGQKARDRIQSNYSLHTVAAQYEELYSELVKK